MIMPDKRRYAIKKIELTFRKGDLLAVFAVLFLTAAAWLPLMQRETAADGAVVQIFRDGALVTELPLAENAEFIVEGEYTNTVTVADGGVSIKESDCPGGDCMHSGRIDSAGRSIVCLPNRVEVRINGQPDTDDVDFVVG